MTPNNFRYTEQYLATCSEVAGILTSGKYKVLRNLLPRGALPSWDALKRFDKYQLTPNEDGFSWQRLAMVEAYFTQVYAAYRGVSLEEARAVWSRHPYVHLSEDETALRPVVTWDQRHDRILGFVQSSVSEHTRWFMKEEEGDTPLHQRVSELFEEHKVGSKVSVVCVTWLHATDIPSLPLSFTLTHSRTSQTASDVAGFWVELRRALFELHGVNVMGLGMDGYSLAAQLTMNSVIRPGEDVFITSYPHWRTGLPVRVRRAATRAGDSIVPALTFQDFVHLGAKFKTRLSGDKGVVFLFNKRPVSVSLEHVWEYWHAQGAPTRALFGIRLSDQETADKMNYRSFERVTNPAALNHVEQQEGDGASIGVSRSRPATLLLLRLMRRNVDAFLHPTAAILDRLRDAWVTHYVFWGWREHLRSTKRVSEGLTSNQYDCVRVNAESLLCLLVFAVRHAPDLPVMPWWLGSQQCESLFRAVRADGDTEADFERMMRRTATVFSAAVTAGAYPARIHFKYPSTLDSLNRRGLAASDAHFLPAGTTEDTIYDVLREAHEEARTIMRTHFPSFRPPSAGPHGSLRCGGNAAIEQPAHTLKRSKNVRTLDCWTCGKSFCRRCAGVDRFDAVVVFLCQTCEPDDGPCPSNPVGGDEVQCLDDALSEGEEDDDDIEEGDELDDDEECLLVDAGIVDDDVEFNDTLESIGLAVDDEPGADLGDGAPPILSSCTQLFASIQAHTEEMPSIRRSVDATFDEKLERHAKRLSLHSAIPYLRDDGVEPPTRTLLVPSAERGRSGARSRAAGRRGQGDRATRKIHKQTFLKEMSASYQEAPAVNSKRLNRYRQARAN